MSKLVDGQRQRDYGDPVEFFQKLAKVWSALLGIEITPEKAAVLMLGFKLVRQANRHKPDNIADMEGYLEILKRLSTRQD